VKWQSRRQGAGRNAKIQVLRRGVGRDKEPSQITNEVLKGGEKR